MISVESYRIFLSVVECTSFSAAAKQLGLTLTKVSRAVAELEGELGTELLTRTTRTVALTPRGAEFAEQLRPAMMALKTALDTARGTGKPKSFKELRVACGRLEGEALIAPAMPSFLQSYPVAQVLLTVLDRPASPENDGFDLVLRLGEDRSDGEALARCEMALVAAPSYCAAHNRPFAAADVAQHRLLVWSGMEQWNLRGSEPIRPHPHFVSNDINVIKECCIAASGLALLPLVLVREEIGRQQLIQLLDGFEPRPLQLVAHHGARPVASSGAKAFLAHLKDWFRTQRL